MNKGFTLIELLVSITIIGILSSVLFLGKTGEEEKLVLQRAIYQLAQDLRETQEMAMGTGEFSCNGSFAHSFGVYFHQVKNSYIIFADCNDNRGKDSSDKEIKEVELGKGVMVYDISPSVPSTVVFTPPDPIIFINKKEWVDYECIVTFTLEADPDNPANQKKVKINSAGRIEIE